MVIPPVCRRTTFAMALLLCFATARGPTAAPEPLPTETPRPGLVVADVFFSPPEPYNGTTFVIIRGTLPDGCTEIVDIDYSWEKPSVHVAIETARPEGLACTTVAIPFQETLKVGTGDIYEGTYYVIENGEQFEFLMPFDFIVPLTPDPGS